MRSRFVSAVLVLLLVLPLAAALPARAATPGIASYHLALGDSLAEGQAGAGVRVDPQCRSRSAPGYVCVFYHYLKQFNPKIQIRNLAQSGTSSCVLVHGAGTGSPCVDPLVTGTLPSQLSEAVDFIHRHPGRVTPITLDIGGDDVLALLVGARNDPTGAVSQLPGVLSEYRTNLDLALSRLRSTGHGAKIIVINQYNPLGGLGTPPLPPGLGGLAKDTIESRLNSVTRAEARKYGAAYADVAAAFDANPGGAAGLTNLMSGLSSGDLTKLDIHPTPAGHRIYARAVMKASGFGLPLRVGVTHKTLRPGEYQTIVGGTAEGAKVGVRLFSGRVQSVRTSVTADGIGNFSARLNVGSNPGPRTIRVCARHKLLGARCAQRLSFSVS